MILKKIGYVYGEANVKWEKANFQKCPVFAKKITAELITSTTISGHKHIFEIRIYSLYVSYNDMWCFHILPTLKHLPDQKYDDEKSNLTTEFENILNAVRFNFKFNERHKYCNILKLDYSVRLSQ